MNSLHLEFIFTLVVIHFFGYYVMSLCHLPFFLASIVSIFVATGFF